MTLRLNIYTFLLAAALVAGCNPVANQAEAALERRLPEIIGPADSYDAEIKGLRALSGEAERVTVVGERVRPEDTPVLERLVLEMQDVKYDRSSNRIERVHHAGATATLRPEDLATFLERNRNVRDVTITLLSPDQASIRMRPSIGGLDLPGMVTVEGRLVADSTTVRFEVERLVALGLNLGETAARRLSEEINPVVDFSDMPARLRVTNARVEQGAIRIQATGNPTGLKLADLR